MATSKSSADDRECDPSLQLDVEQIILDYLAYKTIKSIQQDVTQRAARTNDPSAKPLSWGQRNKLPFDVENGLNMVDSFLKTFKVTHPSAKFTPTLLFRLKLLRFTSLFVYRNYPNSATPPEINLLHLRQENSKRAKDWLANASEDCLPAEVIQWYEKLLVDRRGRGEDWKGLSPSLPTVADLLPLFVDLLATRKHRCTCDANRIWLRLAAEMMLQAILELHLNFEHEHPDMIKEIFAWGFEGMPGVSTANESSHQIEDPDPDAMALDTSVPEGAIPIHKTEENPNIIFCNLERVTTESAEPIVHAKPNHHWNKIRRAYLDYLLPNGNTGHPIPSEISGAGVLRSRSELTFHCLRDLLAVHPLETFENEMLSFLDGIGGSVARPILTQLEKTVGMEDDNDHEVTFEIDIDFKRLKINGEEARDLKELVRKLR